MNFLRNLDELDLERLTDAERKAVYARFAPKARQRVYGRGIRRRLAPMLAGDRRHLELAYSLPGTPLLVYGDEIGMGDDLSLPERQSVRTAMQWSGEPNGGFSSAPAEALTVPAIADGPFGYRHVNVVDQRCDRTSLLSWMQRLIQTRRQAPELGSGSCTVIETDHPAVLALCHTWMEGTVITLHNLSPEPCPVSLRPADDVPEPVVDLIGDDIYAPMEAVAQPLLLNGFGYRWLRCGAVRL